MKNDIRKASSYMRKRWYGWIPNTSGSMSFKTAGRRSHTDMPVTVFSYKIPYHSIDPEQHKHFFQLINRDTGNREDQITKNRKDNNKGFVLSFVCQERDNFDGVLPLLPLIPLLVFIPLLPFIPFLIPIPWLPLHLIPIHLHPFIPWLFLLLLAPLLRWIPLPYIPFVPFLILFSRKWYKKIKYFCFRFYFLCHFKKSKRKDFYATIPYFAFYFGNYISPPDKANQESCQGVESIQGTVFSVMNHPLIKSILKKYTKGIREMPKNPISDELSINRMNDFLGELQNRIQEFVDSEDKRIDGISTDFELERQGIIKMDNFQCSGHMRKYLKNNSDKKDPPKYYANQLFYFIKDVFHAHSHHAETDDCLSSLHSMPDDSSEEKYKLECLRRVFYRLTRRYIQMESEPAGRKHLLGFLAYIGSLQVLINKLGDAINKKLGKNKQFDDGFSPLNLNNQFMRESAEATVERGDAESEQRLTTRRWIYGILTAFGVLAPEIVAESLLTSALSSITEFIYPPFLLGLLGAYSNLSMAFMLWIIWIMIGYVYIYMNYDQMVERRWQALQEWVYWRRSYFQGPWKWLGWIAVGAIYCMLILLYFWIGKSLPI